MARPCIIHLPETCGPLALGLKESSPMSDPRNRPLPVPSGRLSRMARLGGMTARVAGNMAVRGVAELGQGRRPAMRDLLLTPGNVRRITDDLARMRGAAMKLGQLISMDSGEMLPPELAEIMARLRAEADFMPPQQLKSVLSEAWGQGWLKQFTKFDPRPIAAASIGQVHRARLKDGRELAIKVQYPGIARSIDSDVANVAALIKISGLLPKGFDIDPYIDEARQQLHDETDYLREGSELETFASLLKDDDRFVVPDLHEALTRPTVLAMDFHASTPIETAETALAATRDRIAHDLIDLTMTELFRFGRMQTDPNFANYRLMDDGRILLLDFGASREVPGMVQQLYADILRAGRAGDAEGLGHVLRQMGFLDDTTRPEHAAEIIDMMMLGFDTLNRSARYDFGDPRLSQEMQARGMALAEAGFVPPPVPVDVLFVQRKLAGMFLLAARLKTKVQLQPMIDQAINF